MRINRLARAAGLSLVLAAAAVPAFAGEADRARQAIAAAQAKIDAAAKAGADTTAGLPLAQARDSLASAEERLQRGRKEEAISDAQHASELADRAIVVGQDRRVGAERAERRNAEAAAATAQQSAADANARAAAAGERADAAQSAAATAQAEADAARNAPPVVIEQPAPTQTTVATTETKTVKPAHRATRRVVTMPATPAVIADKTTTTVTSTPQ
jgi:hypothetical protein